MCISLSALNRPNSALVTDACAAALRASYSAAQRGRQVASSMRLSMFRQRAAAALIVVGLVLLAVGRATPPAWFAWDLLAALAPMALGFRSNTALVCRKLA